MVAVLERFARLTEGASDDSADALQFAVRQRLPEVQTLVGLRARLDPAVIPAESNAHQCEQQYALRNWFLQPTFSRELFCFRKVRHGCGRL